MKKLALSIVTFLILVFTSNSQVRAVSEFTTSFNSLYVINQDGRSVITHTITIKNNLAHIYATDYTIATSGEELAGITASDEHGILDTDSTVQNGITTIHLTFNKPSIGKDQEKIITLSYQTNSVVEIIGDTMTINIPRLAKANEAENYTRIVRVEGQENKPSIMYPLPNKTEPEGVYTNYTFIGHQNESLTLLFGKSVAYRVNLTYELRNKELKSGISELALPPDTAYQEVILESIEPKPLNIRIDKDGNWLASYDLKPQEKIVVTANLYISVYPMPTLHDPSNTDFIKTSHSKYWETSTETVKDLSNQLKTPQNFYNYLVSNFTYNFNALSNGAIRQGATKALSSPTNVLCTEFTDVFVSLARAQNISSREINGYGYTKNATLQPQNTNSDLLHAWPEYYDEDKKTWTSVDPTWGNTTGGIDYFNKLDFSHITFVRHGLEDSYPLPAGAYKSNPQDKHIQVEIADSVPERIEQTEMKGKTIINTGNVAILHDQAGYLPPHGEFTTHTNQVRSLYDKIKEICAKLLSVFYQQPPASM
jgi:transglutaminase-like putative cysteine protease